MIHLRPATVADLNLLQYWDEQPHVLASDPNDDWGWEVELGCNPDWREQLIAEIDDRPIGVITTFTAPDLNTAAIVLKVGFPTIIPEPEALHEQVRIRARALAEHFDATSGLYPHPPEK
jgi:hypothetical protein